VLLHEGKVFADGAPADVLTDANIETVFSVRSMTPTGRFPRDFRSLRRP
jgi:ABC-type hemin transport system ATPase subunit